ncbi:hypothetical protein DYB34_001876 [Aphanomyces astaci]|uniref:Peptidase A2 domain-containing protein n=1 Tax=Aphanomyces astaci TaxID=112090 RepID=A0A418C3I8_APHAT|nr:hypothetical protein DYB34_001876 [Aphanomyces astaci]
MAACVPLPSEQPAVAQAAEDVDMGFDDAVKRLYVAVQLDTKILDADNRVSRMLDNLMKTLEADGQKWVLHHEGKLVMEIITKAIKPAPLPLAVTKQLQLQRNKVLKSDLFRYVKWLRQLAIGYQLYGGMDEEKPSKPPAEEPRKGNSRPRPRFSPVREEKRPQCRGKEVDGRLPSGAPSVGELRVDHEACKQHGVPSVDRGRSPLPKVLLDSGSDDTLVSEGLLVALERLGASLNVETKPRLMLKRYGETTKSLHVTRQVQFKTVTLETSIGPLVLRGLRAWVEEKKWRSTFSLDVPLWGDWVWDMAEAGDADQTSANVKRLQEAFQEES